MSEKKRLDVLLTERGLQESRQRAQAVIMSGEVFVNGQRVDKPGTAVAEDAQIEVRGGTLAYVSRGGLKLEKAMAAFPIDLNGAVCADIGASTGGFTDCMLQNGAEKVYAVDVGYGQLAWKLRSDPRVVCLERTNARYLTHEQVPDALDFASVDVSFISLKLILPPLNGLLKDGGHAACLVKPQFEAGREKVGKKGVVRDPAVHLEVLQQFLRHAKENDFTVLGITYSPIRGPEGNIEFLLYVTREAGPALEEDRIREAVGQAHAALADNLHGLHVGGVQGEHALHTYAVGNAAHGEGLADAAALAGDHGAFELLDTLPVAFTDVHVHADGVTDGELGDLSLERVLRDSFDCVHLRFLQKNNVQTFMPAIRQRTARFCSRKTRQKARFPRFEPHGEAFEENPRISNAQIF